MNQDREITTTGVKLTSKFNGKICDVTMMAAVGLNGIGDQKKRAAHFSDVGKKTKDFNTN